MLAGATLPSLGRWRVDPSLGAFPFSAAENFLVDAMGAATRWRGRKEEEGAGGDKTYMSKGALHLPSFIARGRPTAGLHDRT